MPAADVTARQGNCALRHGLVTSALVLAVCAALAGSAGASFTAAAAQLQTATARTFGTIVASDGGRVELRWTPADGVERTDPVELAGAAPPVGTRTEVAYDPATPDRPLIPGAALLATADRALGALYLTATVAALVLVVGCWQLGTRRHAAARPTRQARVHRMRVQAGLVSRSWLETESTPRRFIPVHFDPVLVTLPSPATVAVHGDPLCHRLVAVTVDGRVLYPSGPVRSTEPRGRRSDNSSRPDEATVARAARLTSLRHQLRADLPYAIPAPIGAAIWTFTDGGGLDNWVFATALLSAFGIWLAAVRGSDPS
jgi:uncharacterized protein DUF3592